MCPHERNLHRIMARLRFLITPPIYPPMNLELLATRIKIYKKKHRYTYSQLSDLWGVTLSTVHTWVNCEKKPKKETYNRIMNYLENHS